MHKHATWTTVLAAALLVALNALALPNLLEAACATPAGEVVTQRGADTAARLPLPEIPKGFDGYELKFSREMTDREKEIWAEAETYSGEMRQPDKVVGNVSYYRAMSLPRVTYTTEAAARYREATGDLSSHSTPPIRSEVIGSGGPHTYSVCEVGIDLGTVTLFLPDTELTLDQAQALQMDGPTAWMTGILHGGTLDAIYNTMYADFHSWLGHQKSGAYTLSRGMCSDEKARYEQVVNRYLYEGLRAQSSLLTARPADDAMWYDESIRLLHLPERAQMTDDEMLVYYELDRTLKAQAVIRKGMETIPETVAVARASADLKDLLGLDPDAHRAFAALEQQTEGSISESIWKVTFVSRQAPAALDSRTAQGTAEVVVSAKDGHLITARLCELPQPIPGRMTAALSDEWKGAACALVERTLADGKQIVKVDKGSATGNAWKPAALDFIVHLNGGEDYQVGIANECRVVSVRYWPRGYVKAE